MKWTQDKIAHYNVCYNLVKLFPVKALGVVVVFILGLLKELVWDLLMGKGMPELDDMRANIYGILDAYNNKEKRDFR